MLKKEILCGGIYDGRQEVVMAKIGVRLGMTIRLFQNSQYEFFRPEITIDEIDTEQDISSQIEKAKKALSLVWDEGSQLIEELIEKELGRKLHEK